MYIIELVKDSVIIGVGIKERDGTVSWTKPTESGYNFCTKFKDKNQAQKYATKIKQKFQNMFNQYIDVFVVVEYGGITQGTKKIVPSPLKDKVRR